MHGLVHCIVRSPDLTVDYLKRFTRLHQEPVCNVINSLWSSEILRLADDAGAAVLLKGAAGNLTLNAGNLLALPEWLKRGVGAWLRQASAAASRDGVRWRGVLFSSFAPWLPRPIWSALTAPTASLAAAFVRREWADAAGKPATGSEQPSGSPAADRLRLLRQIDPGLLNKGALAQSGVVELDPLADRRIIEFSLALPPQHLLYNGEYRPVARRALAERIPRQVLDAPCRGIQSADWQHHFSPAAASAIIDEIESCETACNLLDVGALRSAAAASPDPASDAVESAAHVIYLPTALAVGIYIKETERAWQATPVERRSGFG